MLNAKSAKITLILNPAEVLSLSAPEGKQFKMTVSYQGFPISIPLNGKGVRKVISAIREVGIDNVAVIVQGKLKIGPTLSLEEAGILAQPRVKKEPTPVEPQQVAA